MTAYVLDYEGTNVVHWWLGLDGSGFRVWVKGLGVQGLGFGFRV